MTTSLLGFAGLAVLALAFVVYPMVRKHKSVAAELDAEDLHRQTHREWYQQRVAEIEQESTDPDARAALQQELAAAVLAETDANVNFGNANHRQISAPSKFWHWYLSAGVLVISGLVYSALSDHRLPMIQGAEVVLTLDETTQSDRLGSWRERLQERLNRNPEDAKSWYLLGHAALKLSDASAAAQAFAKTDALVENDVSVKFYWLQARLMANSGQLDNVSEGLANQLLSMDPNNGPVLELLSVTMMQRGDLHQSIRYMNRAITASGNVDRQIALASAITVLRGRLDAKAPHIAVSVTTTAEPEDRAVVFVVARPPGGGMPYAAVRRPAAMLPFSVQLDDLVSMSEGRSLSAAEEFEILVRVSKQGIAQANTDDWVWRSAVMSQQDLQNGKAVRAILQPN